MATQEAVMTTKDVANRLYELFQENKWMEAQQEQQHLTHRHRLRL